MQQNTISKTFFFTGVGIVILLNATGLFNGIMEADGALYATIAKNIVKSNNWLFLYSGGYDWLDKPHMPFWLAAVGIKIFGVNTFAFKLPSFLCFVISLLYCYKLAGAICNTATARVAALVYATATHIIISNFDGKAEIYLTTFIIAATYHMYRAMNKKWLLHILLAGIFSACAVMTKGIFTLITIAAGFVILWIKTKQWQQFIHPKWYLLLVVILVCITPELYALYTQFDQHPEKIIFGHNQVSGIRFFVWDSQFGRFFNNGPIKGEGDPIFFVHTTLWAFLPWAILFIAAIANIFFKKKNTRTNYEGWIIKASALVTFIIFSLSKFQLPHYIIILFPHFAIITAHYISSVASDNALKKFSVFQTVLYILLLVLLTAIIVVFGFTTYAWFIVVAVIISAVVFFYITDNTLGAILKKNIGFALLLAIFLNLLFYPVLFTYQSGMMAAEWLNKRGFTQPVVTYKYETYSLDYYYKGTVTYTTRKPYDINHFAADAPLLLFLHAKDTADIDRTNIDMKVLQNFSQFWISKLTLPFLNKQTRAAELEPMVLVLLKRKNAADN